ncbi:MAG: M61 family metallopeptidase [Candidatus Tectimicrobiota bacterium]
MPELLEPLHYTLRFPAPHTHYVALEMLVPTGGKPVVELAMAVWTPGSYLVREYARHVEEVVARTPEGRLLSIDKSRKNRWRIPTHEARTLVVTYRVYCREMSVRTNWIEEDFALLNGAPTFLTLAEDASRAHVIQLVLPDTWHTSVTGLPPAPGDTAHRYLAADFDTLVDSPILAGNPAVYPFEVDGIPHYLVNEGEGGLWDGLRSARDVAKLVRAHRHMWGFLPYDKYVFFNMITEAGGGLEHKNSTILMTSRWHARVAKDYLSWLGLVSHEFFHVWNVKRLRPVELGPFDYENEVYTKNLWTAEGITSYYTELGLRRAGLCSHEEFLERLSGIIQRLQTTPGRLVHPLEMASYDAWIKFYRYDENSANTTVSYYTKGAVVSFLLDARIQAASGGARSLDDLLRLAYSRYAGAQGFTREEFRALAQEVAGTDLSAWFVSVLETTDELDYTQALTWFGLRFKPLPETAADKGWLGLLTKTENGRLLVTQVQRHTPGWLCGFNVDDELLAIDDYRVLPQQWETRLGQYRPGDQATVLVARREQLRRLPVTFGAEPAQRWQLEVHPEASAEQRARFAAWTATMGNA